MNLVSKIFHSNKEYKIGISLSGGGVRGFAHLGILKALNEKGIYPDVISGTSAGALAGIFMPTVTHLKKAMTFLSKQHF